MNEIKEKIKRFETLRSEASVELNSITTLLKPYMDFIKSDYNWVVYVEYDDKTNRVAIQYQDWDEYDPEYRNKIDRIGLEYFDDPEAYVSKLKAQKEKAEKEKARLDKERKEEESRKAKLAEFERLKKELFPDEKFL